MECTVTQMSAPVCLVSVLLVEVFACSRQARQLFIEDIFLGAHTVALHVFGPVQLTHIKIENLQKSKRKKHSVKIKTLQ